MKNIILLLLIACSFWLSAETTVGGHISQNTVWTKANSPYLVKGVIYIDQNATLFIQPGVEVRINAALLADSTYLTPSFSFTGNQEPLAKLFIVKGRIIAQGTKTDSIVFTRIQKDSAKYRWGVIQIKETAGLCIFRYCRFDYSGRTNISLMDQPAGTITADNGNLIVEKCLFKNHIWGIGSTYYLKNVMMINNEFWGEDNDEILNSNMNICHVAVGVDCQDNIQDKSFLFAGNKLNGRCNSTLSHTGYAGSVTGYFVKNKFLNSNRGSALSIYPDDSTNTYVYDNYIKNAYYALTAKLNNPKATAVIHKNTIVCDSGLFGGGGSVFEARTYLGGLLDVAYNDIKNGYLRCDVGLGLGKVYNNTITNTTNGCYVIHSNLDGRSEIYNNIVINSLSAYSYSALYSAFYNNLSYNTNIVLHDFDNGIQTKPIQNCIFLKNNRWNKKDYIYTPIRNCVIDREWPEHLYITDGGGNIKVDSTAYDSLFADYLNHDFNPKAGSRLIDAGFDTTGFYNSVAQNWFNRVADGNNDGIARIDIGPFEYGAKALGKLKGRIFNSLTGEGADYVLVKFNDNKTLFTFSDSLGYYEARLPAGNYNLHCNRLLYDNLEHNNININDEQVTTLNLSMNPDDTGITFSQDEKIMDLAGNYPNPFNATTNITFNTRHATPVKLTIYNIKGEVVLNSLYNFTQAGKQRIGLNCINLSSGVYLYKLELATSGKQLLGKMNLVK